jgi:transcriptional regulator with XRE-family HTH domain
MTQRIRTLLEQHLAKHGRAGKAQLCQVVEKSENTLNRWLRDGIPSAHDAYKLALACGCSEKEALRLAREEALSEVAKEPA